MEEILNNTEEKMMLTIESLESKFTNVRAGRANPNMLDGIMRRWRWENLSGWSHVRERILMNI